MDTHLARGSVSWIPPDPAGRRAALEQAARELLTPRPGESFELHVLRIAHAPGEAGELARARKLADIDALLLRAADDPLRWDQPPYAWARRHLGGGPAVPTAPATGRPGCSSSG